MLALVLNPRIGCPEQGNSQQLEFSINFGSDKESVYFTVNVTVK
jgi:hypothetical protein